MIRHLFLYIGISFLMAYSLFYVCSSHVAVSCFDMTFEEGDIITIDKKYNLNGDKMTLPYGVTMNFTGKGKIYNGVIIGSNTRIVSEQISSPIFEAVRFEGNFIGVAESQWFSLKYGRRIDNSKELNSALELAHLSSVKTLKLKRNSILYLKSDIPTVKTRDFLRTGTVEIKSGVCFDLNGSMIKCLSNESKCYNILFSRCSNNIIIRNGVICGDSREHRGSKGEWGYGIELQGVQGFVLENLECKYCWGDGINIQVAFDGDGSRNSDVTRRGHCSDGVIKSVNCHHNRRQGMSVEGIIGLKILNSTFSYTSGAKPQSGLDIEPYSSKNIVCDVLISDCIFENNAYSGILMMGTNVSDVYIDNCFFKNNKQFDCTLKGDNIFISNCIFPTSIRLVDACTDVEVKYSTIEKFLTENFSKGEYIKNIKFHDCNMLYPREYTENLIFAKCTTVYDNCRFK